MHLAQKNKQFLKLRRHKTCEASCRSKIRVKMRTKIQENASKLANDNSIPFTTVSRCILIQFNLTVSFQPSSGDSSITISSVAMAAVGAPIFWQDSIVSCHPRYFYSALPTSCFKFPIQDVIGLPLPLLPSTPPSMICLASLPPRTTCHQYLNFLSLTISEIEDLTWVLQCNNNIYLLGCVTWKHCKFKTSLRLRRDRVGRVQRKAYLHSLG